MNETDPLCRLSTGFAQMVHCGFEEVAQPEPNESDGQCAIRLVVAYSGGLDSHLLLLLAHRWCTNLSHVSLRAITINHGLQDASAEWSVHCLKTCGALGIDHRTIEVQVAIDKSKSPEEAAREARYQALSDALLEKEYLLTGHHADDQAETFLLQLIRGAGVRGLASMPLCRVFSCGFHMRPLLGFSRDELVLAGQQQGLHWIEDPSNRDVRFARNYLRNRIIPELKNRWPAVSQNISRSASHCAEAAKINSAAAEAVLGPAIDDKQLEISSLQKMPLIQQKNVLRSWLERHGYQPPSQAQLERIVDDLLLAPTSASGKVSFGDTQLGRYKNHLYLADRGELDDAPAYEYQWTEPKRDLVINETGQCIAFDQIDCPGLAVRLADGKTRLSVRSRQGGEKLRLAGHSHSKTVKSLLQEGGYPPWQRSRLPMVYLDGQLIGIIGLGFASPLPLSD